ncbi:Lipase 3 [Cyphellophora attinorum]|uniref:Carboxylic ester hydrolase n=1 Tax=Cyphellophora attinorum TaxID=1664694 RepID=A0A0N1P139_9EURO|nr:Lipase 3 [Phialophora attinorum]KPI43767.1 Lipase 3 [Phialophora attinorum]
MTEYVHKHHDLGEFRGLRRGDDVVQFRGIPYADIPGRFFQAQLRTKLPQTPFDATRPGPICPQNDAMPFPPLWQKSPDLLGPALTPPVADEFHCLNLNVTAPLSVLEGGEPCPVMGFIHGGAFMTGSASVQVGGREIYDATNLVHASITLKQPIIVVAINYRLGPLGFLASKQLKELNESRNEPIGNYGLHDQAHAIEWVSRFIAGFGGDPSSITLQGASAGGASCHFQAVSFSKSRVKRAILASGTALAIGAMPLDYHQDRYDALCRKFGEEQDDYVNVLQSVPVQVLVNEVSSVSKPLIDEQYITGRGMPWLKDVPTNVDLLIGSCEYEDDVTLAILGHFAPSPPTAVTLGNHVEAALIPSGVTSMTSKYFSPEMLNVIFRVPPYLIAGYDDTAAGKVYVYEFQAKSPYPNWPPGYDRSHHAVTDVFLFDVASDLVPEQHRNRWSTAVSELRSAWIKFCWGELPWEAATTDGGEAKLAYVLKDNKTWQSRPIMGDFINDKIAARWEALLRVAD